MMPLLRISFRAPLTTPRSGSGPLPGLADNITAAKEMIRKDIGTVFDEFSKIAEKI